MNPYKQPYNLRNKVMIQKKAQQVGPFPSLDDYDDYKPLWAEVRFLKGRNLYSARAANVKTDVEFIIRYREDIDEKMRVNYKNQNYNIEGIIPLDAHEGFLMIQAYNIKHDM